MALAIVFGVYPQAIFNYMTPSVDQTVDELATWTKDVKEPRLKEEAATAAAPLPLGRPVVAQQTTTQQQRAQP